ncbi:MarR family transcriptional regulator [Janibacter alkaliphilus]|uniref:HTH-type transcriptional regulator MgrA n=1 Tax=Janibacter alkaliphilus TaxID=1069963 RepID=A0A852X5G8_9MICO|nr:DNA-binding MarR family transcriptional regulator [Janibacter alkaliphilus]
MSTAPLDDQICFALHAASRAAVGCYRESLDELGLTYPQYVTLLALWERDGQSVRELGEALQLDSGTLSPLLRRMADADLVERRREGRDGRAVTVHLTDAGRALESQVAAVQQRVYGALQMTPEELATLRALAQRFSETTRTTTRTTDRTTKEIS